MEEWKPSFVMVLVQFAYAATSVLAKLAAHDGMSMRVLTAYRLIFGAAFSLSLALIFERCIHILFFSLLLSTSLLHIIMAKTYKLRYYFETERTGQS